MVLVHACTAIGTLSYIRLNACGTRHSRSLGRAAVQYNASNDLRMCNTVMRISATVTA